MKPRHGGRSAEVARALASVRREQSEQRARARVVRRARSLGWLDASAFGHRMPSAAALVRDAEWARETPDHACWRCGVTRVPFEDVAAGCAECRDRAMACVGVPIHGVVRLGRYAPPLSQWVPAIKQRAWRDMGVTLGRELGLQVLDAVATGRIPKPDEVVPVPVHWLRRLIRGIDHAQTIAGEVARVLGVPCSSALRVPLARRQTGGSREGRLDNRRRFDRGPRPLAVPRGVVLVVDDVRTTGGTMRDAAIALAGQGAAGFVMAACAVADPPSRASLRQNVDKF